MIRICILASGSAGNAILARAGETALLIDSEMRYFSTPSAFELGSFHITPFTVPHDAANPVGFVVRYHESSFAVATDLGYAPKSVVNAMRGVNAVLLESNHDEAMLEQDVKRPPSVKQRILSHHGHLSNRAAADLITEIATPDLRHVLLAHLSEDCNTPSLAINLIRGALQKTGNSHTKVDCPGASGAQLPYSITI